MRDEYPCVARRLLRGTVPCVSGLIPVLLAFCLLGVDGCEPIEGRRIAAMTGIETH